ncbi:tRNA pseudouridine(38-40) synthase TruA [Planctomycetota bacterium]
MAQRKILLTIQYDGTDYHGWQVQPGCDTIQGCLTHALQSLFGTDVQIKGASRTDAGVNALGQLGLIQVDSPIPTENLSKALTARVPRDVAVSEAVDVPLDFDLSAAVKNKLYRYTICTALTRPVLRIRRCWHLPKKLDTAAMAEAAGILVGKHDFKSFASAADTRENSIRTIFRCDVTSQDDLIYIDVEGDGFLYNMVRNIVGSLVEVGTNRWKPEKMQQVLDAKNRTAAGPIAPPAGLCLMWIKI